MHTHSLHDDVPNQYNVHRVCSTGEASTGEASTGEASTGEASTGEATLG